MQIALDAGLANTFGDYSPEVAVGLAVLSGGL